MLLFSIRCTAKSLYWACKHSDLEKVLQLLCAGVQPNARVKESHNQTGLHMAATMGECPISGDWCPTSRGVWVISASPFGVSATLAVVIATLAGVVATLAGAVATLAGLLPH